MTESGISSFGTFIDNVGNIRRQGMRIRGHGRSGYVAIVGALGFAWMGCATRTEMTTAPELGRSGATPISNSKSTTSSNDYCEPFTAFDFRSFSNPTRIDNVWSPLTPGRRYVLE